jgi:hypothetical protein
MKPSALLGLAFALGASAFSLTTAHAQSASGRVHPSIPPQRIPDSLGTNIHFTDEKPGEARMMAEGGFRVVRMDLTWASTERQKGVYDFSAYDRLVKSLEGNKLKPYFILDYGNALYSPSSKGGPMTEEADTPAFRAGFAKWAAAAVQRYKGRGILWEIWNEPNHDGFWKPKPDAQAYSRLALEASRAVAPAECILGPATSTIDMEFLEVCFQAGLLDFWDAVSVHPYRQSTPETVMPEYRLLRRLIDRHKPRGKAVPVLSGEWGYSSAWNDHDENRQGKYLPRQWLVNQVNGVPVSIWYDWHDDGEDPKEAEHNFGTTRHAHIANRATPYDPKPAYNAARTLYRQLDGFSFNKRLWTGREDEWVLLFTRGADVRLAAWSSDASKDATPRTVSLPASDGAFSVTGHLSESKPMLQARRQKLQLTLDDSVSYIVPQGANALLRRAAAWKTEPLEEWVVAPRRLSPAQISATSGISTGLSRQDGGALQEQPTVLRDAEPMRRVTRSAEGFAQATEVLVGNPLKLQIEAGAAPGTLQVRVLSPMREAAEGSLRVALDGAPAISRPFSIPQGQSEAIVAIELPAKALASTSPAQGQRIDIVAQDAKGQPLVRRRRLRMVPLDSFAREGAANDYAALADGDAKVTGTQAVSVARAPQPLGGQPIDALRLSYEWTPGWRFVRVLPPATLKLEGRPLALQMWVYGDNSGNVMRARLRDETGQTFQPNGQPLDINFSGWKLVTFPLDGSGGFWGGANDGILHGALSWDSLFLLDNASRQAGKGALYLANPTLVYEDAAIER